MRVVIVDDQSRFRHALATVVELTDGIVLAHACDSVAQLRAILERNPGIEATWDVVLMDLEMPGESGLVGLELLKDRRPTLRVVMCTVYDDGESIREAIRRGADGYLLKRAPVHELLERLEDLRRGGAALAPEVARDLLDHLRDPGPPRRRWRVASDGSWAIAPTGDRIDLSRRQAARRILAFLARSRVEAPGESWPAARCIEAGWPGEKMAHASAQARLWTAIRTLRQLGLEEVIETVGEGYRVSVDVDVQVI